MKKEALFEKEMMPRRFWSVTQQERNDIEVEERRGEVEEDIEEEIEEDIEENEQLDSRGDGSPGRKVYNIYLLYTFFCCI